MVLRHAQSEWTRPGFRDHDRRLTPDGRTQARDLGARLRSDQVAVDLVLCSSATRARQTLDALDLVCPVVVTDRLYNAGAEEIGELVRQVTDEVSTLLVVGHAPGLPTLAYELADPGTSDPDALDTLETRYPAGTLATLRVAGAWADLRAASLVALRLP